MDGETGVGAVDGMWSAMVLWTVSGTYDASATAPIEVLAAAAAIEASLRNGRTVTLVDAMRGQRASKASDASLFMSTANVVLSSGRLEMDITDEDETTEIADAALPAQDRPFGTLVRFTVA
jgi:hypothetical protein